MTELINVCLHIVVILGTLILIVLAVAFFHDIAVAIWDDWEHSKRNP